MINFSKYKLQLNEGQAISRGAQSSMDAAQKGTESATMGAEKAMNSKQLGFVSNCYSKLIFDFVKHFITYISEIYMKNKF